MKGIREKMQDDIDEVNKIAHQVKNRLERLDKMNEQALSRPVRSLWNSYPDICGFTVESSTLK